MAKLKPTFALTIGSFNSTTDNPVGGPGRIVVDRDMNVAADAFELDLFDCSGVALDDEVTVELGHDGKQELVFTGNVVELRPALVGTRLLALGKMNGLLNLRTAATYEDKSVGDIVKDLISQAGIDAGTIDGGPTLPRFAVDQHAGAWRFVKDLADRLGFELFTDRAGKVMFRALGAAAGLDAGGLGLGGALGAATGALAGAFGLGGGEGYQFGKHLIGAAATRRVETLGQVSVGGESPASTKGDSTSHWLTTETDGLRGANGGGDPQRLLLDSAARTKDLADRFAAGYRTTLTRDARRLSVTTLGRPNLELGDGISVSDIPEAMANGSGYAQAIRHRFGAEIGFLTDLRLALES